MNERIRQLAVEAKLIASEPNGFDPTGLTKSQEKFAELIVNQCAKACEKNSYLALNGWQRAKQIREHFGVKE
jgi:hypothetical protein